MFRILFFINLLITFHVCSSQVLLKPVSIDLNILVPRVVAGTPAKLGEFPYQLALKILVSRSRRLYHTFCGAVIIAPAKILTAAHCYVKDKSNCQKCILPGHVSKKNTFAVAGCLLTQSRYSNMDSLERGQWRRVKSVKYPKGYKFPKHDIAVAFPSHPFTFNANVGSIKFSRKFIDYTGKCLVSGFGLVGPKTTSKRTNVLLKADLDLIPWSWCNRLLGRNMRKFVCTSIKVTDVGNGDSGGPLVCDVDEGNGTAKILVGIVSGSYPKRASFFTRVSSYHLYVEKTNRCGHTFIISTTFWTCLFLIYTGFLLF